MNPRWLFALAWLGCKHPDTDQEPEAPPVHVTCSPVVRTSIPQVRTMRGTVVAAPDRDAVISPQVAGRLLRVIPHEGDAVAANAAVAEVESQPVRDALVQARAQLAQAEATARNADIAATRSQHLFERGIAARQEVDDANARRAETEAAVTAARATVDVAERNLSRATVRSPIAGVVVRVIRRPGEVVDGTPATPVLEVADPNALEFLATATPADLVTLRPGQSASIHFDALPNETIAATVRMVAPSIDPATGVGTVRFTIPVGATRPPFGLFGVARVDVGVRPSVTVVPASAVRNAPNGGTEVAVCDHDHARVRTVDVGEREASWVEITRGVSPGERVVSDGLLGLADGAEIVEQAEDAAP